jgi:succinate dehydrogenase / fumarate reductase iron-sulfur subunit
MTHPESSRTISVVFNILRFNPETNAKPYFQAFEVPVSKGMTVLEGLTWIKEHVDSTLAWRSSCRMGVCGSCGVFINGYPRLACNNQILHISDKQLNIKPLPNYDIIRDLVPDLEDFFDQHRSVNPYLIRKDLEEQDTPSGEYFQTSEEMMNYIQFAYCIKCGLCLSACPTCATDEAYIGPMALAQAWRYQADSRDEGEGKREEVYENKGVWRCHFAGSCSEVCPKGVDPALAIQLLKRDRFLKTLKLKPKATSGNSLAPGTPDEWTHNPDIPQPPDPTV